jgi:hypothetical protein
MDPLEPIDCISLHAYAELCALMKDTGTDVDAQAAIAAQHGHGPTAWEAARTGWTQRMSDPSTAGAVAAAFMPLYQAALSRSGSARTATFEQYVQMSALVQQGIPFETMYAQFGITGADWSQISTAWVEALTRDPKLATRFADAVAAERAKPSS